MMKFHVLLVFSLLVLAASCGEKEEEETPPSPVPAITFTSLTKQQGYLSGIQMDSVTFGIAYTDGDGDLGLARTDTMPPYRRVNPDGSSNTFYFNYFLEIYRKKNGVFSLFSPLGFISYGRMPVISPAPGRIRYGYFDVTAESAWRGEIYYSFILFNYNNDLVLKAGDTLRCKISIADRALHVSNTVETPEFIFLK